MEAWITSVNVHFRAAHLSIVTDEDATASTKEGNCCGFIYLYTNAKYE